MLPLASFLVLQLSPVQSWAARRAAQALSVRLGAEVSVEKVFYVFFNQLIVTNVHILSAPSDTLLQVNKLSITLHNLRPFDKNLSLKKVVLHGGVFHLEIEEDRRTNVERILKIQRRDMNAEARPPFEWMIGLEEFTLKDFRFTLKNGAKSRHGSFPHVMDFSDLDVQNINLDLRKVRLERDTLFCTISNLYATEKSGYVVKQLNGDVAISGGCVHIRRVSIQDSWSDIKATDFYMHYRSARDFRSFTDSVRLEANFTHALLSFNSLAYYAPALDNNNLTAFISGHVEGPVYDLKSDALSVASQSGQTQIEAGLRIKGLPNATITTAFLDIHHLNATAGDVAHILYQISGLDPAQITQYVSPDTALSFEGGLSGLLTDFVVNGTLHTDMGEINVDAILHQEKNQGLHINGHLGTHELNLKNIIGEPFGALSMHTHTHTLLRHGPRGGMEAMIDSLRIHKIEINNYPFSRIFAVGAYKEQRFDGRVVCSDPNLNFIFQGLANLNYKEFQPDQTARYDFLAQIAYADLAAIGVDPRDTISRLSGSVRANFQRSIDGDVTGSVIAQQADYTNSTGVYHLGTIHVDSHVHDSSYRFELSAPFAKAVYTGNEGLGAFVKDVRYYALSRYIPNYFTPEYIISKTPQYHIDVTVYDMLAIGQLALPGLYIAPETHLTATLTSSDSLHCLLRSAYIRYKEQRASNVSVDVTGNAQALRSTVSAFELNTLGQVIDTVNILLHASQNSIDTRLHYSNQTGENSEGALSAQIFFAEDTERANIAFHIKPSYFIVNRERWALDSSVVLFDQNDIHFNHLKLHKDAQSLIVDGIFAKNSADTLHLALNQFDISLLNPFLNHTKYRFSGEFTGHAQVIDFYHNRQLLMDMNGNHLYVNDNDAGSLALKCQWNHDVQCFQIGVQNILHGDTPVSIAGFYYPDNKYLNLNALLRNLSVSYFEPFLSSMISDFNGDVSGEMNLSGTLPDLSLTSHYFQANDVGFTVNFTQTPYIFNGPITLHEHGFTAQNGIVTDRFGNKGVVNGGMKYRYFRDISVDVDLDFKNLHSLSTKESDSNAFYGDAFATGRMHAYGNFRQMMLDIVAKTEKNTSIHIPLFGAAEAKQSTRLSFVTPPELSTIQLVDPLEMNKIREKVKEPTQVSVKLNAEVTPDAELLIEINKATGNVISGFGSGNISIGVDPVKSLFDIVGDYTISSGVYDFILQGVFSRKFHVIPGGRITFNGDIFKTSLDLTAAYRTKSSINTLLADNSSIASLRDVECQIFMTGNMMNPNLGFNIEVADLAPETRSRVQAAFTPEDKLVRQFMALLVSGSFIPDQQSGIVNNTSSILYSNATDILSNQLNNILGQLNFPVDVGLNYQPNDNGRDIFDVAISTQLFNNRVVVNGNVGNMQASGTTGDIGGNIDIEVKITDNGNFRIKAFSHAADQYSTYYDLDNTQRNGGGLTYQEDFNSFRELFQKIFTRKKRRLVPEANPIL